MSRTDFTSEIEAYIQRLRDVLSALDRQQIDDVINTLLRTYENGNTVYIFGNGGTAQHSCHDRAWLPDAYPEAKICRANGR